MSRRRFRAGLVVIAAFLAMIASTASASASTTTATGTTHGGTTAVKESPAFGGQSLITLQPGVGCVDSGGGFTSAKYPILYMHACNSGDFQQWNWVWLANETVVLQDAHYRDCIDVGQPGTMFPCYFTDWQQFTPRYVATVNGYDYYTFRSVHYPSYCLDAGQGKPMLFPCNQGYWQMFARY